MFCIGCIQNIPFQIKAAVGNCKKIILADYRIAADMTAVFVNSIGSLKYFQGIESIRFLQYDIVAKCIFTVHGNII